MSNNSLTVNFVTGTFENGRAGFYPGKTRLAGGTVAIEKMLYNFFRKLRLPANPPVVNYDPDNIF
jgi:hypothetical protein